jgi:hypothetical protein
MLGFKPEHDWKNYYQDNKSWVFYSYLIIVIH